ncbi:MAG: helix-turn-helix transcriptional regulator [Deltaproteobacteria bacterium]|nr:helix-turn-helix transcriptional regulator [Deltaproteobacteria bacterium]
MTRSPEDPAEKRSDCPIANVLDLLGDKWTLLVIRDMLFFGKRLYKEFADSSERIPTNILADRLRRMEQAQLLKKEAYQKKPVRYSYHLTAKGWDVLPVLKAIMEWAFKHCSGTSAPSPEKLAEIKKNIRKAKPKRSNR